MVRSKNYCWNVNKSEFQGYMKAKVEDIYEQILEIKVSQQSIKKETDKNVCDNRKEIDAMKIDFTKIKSQATLIGSAFAIIVSIAVALLSIWFKR